MDWLWIVLIAALVYIGIDYGRLLFKVKRFEQEETEELDMLMYTPIRQLFICAKDGSIAALAQKSIEAHKKAGDGIRVLVTRELEKYTYVIFESGDEVRIYDEGAQMDALSQREIENYAYRVFFDYGLPDSAIRATIDKLGLRNYMINFGLCDKEGCGRG